MRLSPYSGIGLTQQDIQIQLQPPAGIPAAPAGFYVPPGFQHLFYGEGGIPRAEASPLLVRSASPGVGWLPDVVPALVARVGDSAVDVTGTRLHLLRLAQEWGNKGLFTVLIAQGGLAPSGSFPNLDSMTYEAFPVSALPNIKNQPGVFIVGLPNNEPSTAAAWAKYTGGGTTTTTTPGTGTGTLPTPKCPPQGVYRNGTCDCKALGPTAVFDTVSFLCVDCGPNTVPYVQGSKDCGCLPGYVPIGKEGAGCVLPTGQVTPLPVPIPPPPAVATGNPISDWWGKLDDRQKGVAAVTGMVGVGVLTWLAWHGTRDGSNAYVPATPSSRWERDMGHRYAGAGPSISYRSNRRWR